MLRRPWALSLMFVAVLVVVSSARAAAVRAAIDGPGASIEELYARQVDMRLDVPIGEQLAYGERLRSALAAAGLPAEPPQYWLLIDRSPVVQAAFIYLHTSGGEWRLVGASPVSTGQAGGFEHFVTPLGVFEHTTANMDFRAEGTRNANGIRGYGARGMRVFDFGWVEADRTWGAGGRGLMRLQVHATDPDILERQLGRPRSKGCIRIAASLNRFLDHYGLLDADYERAVRDGRNLWVLRADREPAAWAGKYLVVVDSGSKTRPPWSRWPPRYDRSSSGHPAPDAHAAPREQRGDQTGNAAAESGNTSIC